jgi:hypothetical protein
MAGSGTNGTGTVGSNDGVARRVWTERGGGGAADRGRGWAGRWQCGCGGGRGRRRRAGRGWLGRGVIPKFVNHGNGDNSLICFVSI